MASTCALFLCVPVLPFASGTAYAAAAAAPASEAQKQTFDMQSYIDKALASGQKEVVIPPGRYRVAPRGGHHLRITGLSDVKIIADGVEMICTQTTRAVSIDHCNNVTLRGLTIDYDPLPCTQGKITALAPDKSWLEFELYEGYPDKPEAHLEIFDGKSETLKSPTHYGWRDLQNLGQRRYRISKSTSYRYNARADAEEIGDIVVLGSGHAPGGNVPHAIVSSGCRDLQLQDVTVYASNCFTFFEVECDKTTYLRCALKPRPREDDPVQRAHRRIRSGNADAFHSKHARRGPQIIDCTAKFQGDDCVNICGDYFMIGGTAPANSAAAANTLRVLLHRSLNIEKGDTVELVNFQGQRLPDAKVTAIVPADAPLQEAERTFIAAQRMDRNIQSKLTAPDTKAMLITLDRPVSLPMGSVVASTHRMGNGFLVKGCDFGFNRSRGILIKGSDGKVLDNKITSTWYAAVLVSPEWWWLESGSSVNLEISGNVVRNCRATAIIVTSHGGNGELAPSGAHRNITIEGNTLESPAPCIAITSTDGLNINRNTLPSPDAKWIHWKNCSSVKINAVECDGNSGE